MVRWPEASVLGAVLAAIIEVVGLGGVALYIAGNIDEKRVKLEHDLAAESEFQARRFETIEELAALVNRAGAHAAELIEVSSGPWNQLGDLAERQRLELEAQRRAVVTDFNAFTREWRVGRATVGLRIHDYYTTGEEAPEAISSLQEQWRRLEQTVDDYLAFAGQSFRDGSVRLDIESDLREEMQWRLETLSRGLLSDLMSQGDSGSWSKGGAGSE